MAGRQTESTLPIDQQLAILRLARNLFLCLAIPLLVVGAVLLVRSVLFVSSAERVDAVVSDVESRSTEPGSQMRVYTPTFRFQDAAGQQHTVRLAVSSSSYDYERGERVAIRYDPADPQQVRVCSFFGTWGVTLIVLALGLFSAFFAFVTTTARKTLEKRVAEGES